METDNSKLEEQVINVTRSSMPPLDEYIEEIKPLWESHYLTNRGVKHRQLEQQLAEYLKVKNVMLYVNGHNALEGTFETMGLAGEAITTPFTFASTTHSLVRKGLTPVFVDVDPHTFTLDPAKIEAAITPRTSAIVPVHVYGNLCDVDAIQEIADKHGLKVVYDAAHAFGVEKDGVGVGNFGDASILSFHATKVFNTIEGGAVCFKDDTLGAKLSQYRNFGITGVDTVEYVGGNSKLNEFAAAMGICNLRHINDEVAKRRKVFERYLERLEGVSGIQLCHDRSGIKHTYAYMPVIFTDEFGATRDEIFDLLGQHNIFSRKYFYPLTSEFACYKGVLNPGDTPIAHWAADHVLTLPMYADLEPEHVDRICDLILGCAR